MSARQHVTLGAHPLFRHLHFIPMEEGESGGLGMKMKMKK
jgi:hypothetical protein